MCKSEGTEPPHSQNWGGGGGGGGIVALLAALRIASQLRDKTSLPSLKVHVCG